MLQGVHRVRSYNTCSFGRAYLVHNSRGSNDLFRAALAYTSNTNAVTRGLIHSSSMATDEASSRLNGKSSYREGMGRSHEDLRKARC